MGLKVTTSVAGVPEPAAETFNALHGIGAQAPGIYLKPCPALTVNVTVYVDSATGSDSNDGLATTSAFRTLARAWLERQLYGELRATFRVQLIGAGPYDMPAMGFSACGADGSFVLCGDTAAETIVATGTATGDFAGNVLPTSATGGTNNLRDEFLRVLSGNCAQCVFQINENAANSITVAQVRGRTQNGVIVNGDTWQVVRPGTQLRIVNSSLVAAATPNIISGWNGQSVGTSTPTAKHWLYNLRLTTTDASQIKTLGAAVGFVMVRAEAGIFCLNSTLVLGTVVRSTDFGIASANLNLLFGAGLVVSGGLFFLQSCFVVGVFTYAGSSASLADAVIIWGGGRGGVALSLQLRSQINTIGAGQDILLNATITVSGANSAVRMGATGTIRIAVTVGNCFRAIYGGVIQFGAPSPTGGTTDAAGFAFDVRGGGQVFFQNVLPAITGGTAGADLRTTNVTAANAVLAANGTPVGNAADVLLGEVIARVA